MYYVLKTGIQYLSKHGGLTYSQKEALRFSSRPTPIITDESRHGAMPIVDDTADGYPFRPVKVRQLGDVSACQGCADCNNGQ